MQILKISSFLIIFKRIWTKRGDSKRFGDFPEGSTILDLENKHLMNILRRYLWM